jgi:dTMP kinase
VFIAIEGPEGSGKSTLAEHLVGEYKQRGLPVIFSREPGGTLVGEEFRRILKDPRYRGKFPPMAELFGFLAARVAFVEEIVRPALRDGYIVITDRYSLSTMAYQIWGRLLIEQECMFPIKLAESRIKPYYVVLMVEPEIGLRRKSRQGDADDRFAQEDLEFHRRVAEGYRRYAKREGGLLIDTDTMSQESVLDWVTLHLDRRFPKELLGVSGA